MASLRDVWHYSVVKTALYFGWADQSEVSGKVLAQLRQHFSILHAQDFHFSETVDQDAFAAMQPDFLFSFSPVILRKKLLDAVRIAAINFHTAPPRWPGRGSCSFALMEGDTEFGVTAHLMEEKVDAGAILTEHRFPIVSGETVATLHAKAIAAIPVLAEKTLKDLEAHDGKPTPSGAVWERDALTMNDMMNAMEILEKDSPEVVQRKIRAFAHPTKPGPYIVRAGQRFWYLPATSR